MQVVKKGKVVRTEAKTLLEFDVRSPEFKAMMKHTAANPECIYADGKIAQGTHIMLVKDEGVYLFTGSAAGRNKSKPVYATRLNNDDILHNEDLVMCIPLADMQNAVKYCKSGKISVLWARFTEGKRDEQVAVPLSISF